MVAMVAETLKDAIKLDPAITQNSISMQVIFKPVLVGVRIVAHSISSYEQTQ